MSMTAAHFALQPIHVSDHDPGWQVEPPEVAVPLCDFRGDGRVIGALVHPRSAWSCPLFYLAIPAYAVLAFAAAAIRLCDRVGIVPNHSAR